MGLKLVFLGTPRFAVLSLEALAAAGHEIAGVWTQPDRPRGRGHETSLSPVKECALRLGIPVHQPERIRRPDQVEALRAIAPHAMVVVGYGQIIPKSIIDIPRLGILNVHASLLPKYRGAAPIQWAIARGETSTGVTIMRIDEGLDTGDILVAEETPIGPDETAPELSERLAAMGSALLVPSLNNLDNGSIVPHPQDHSQATLAPILKKEDGRIDWTLSASEIRNRLRGFDPWPGAFTSFRGQTLHISRAAVAAEPLDLAPGTLAVAKRRLLAASGASTVLELMELQLEGRKRISAEAFINGHRPLENERLGV